MTELQKKAIESIHEWDKQSLLVELEALIMNMDDEEIQDTILYRNDIE